MCVKLVAARILKILNLVHTGQVLLSSLSLCFDTAFSICHCSPASQNPLMGDHESWTA